ncbi:hypothetical protein JR316_0008107 [Psilocybe cubensis]|uniref:Uncharacterized protein n=2 Tax=Psilocybe cubensis TaxID=181762 RepID=A0ACB8GV49_PSICU|nr:hypothetical protein JR316_0008107 [Psilocybe cubensis]KAH9479513.1 hypothetical protein JR316_0008107 [Psilocybe cubensis]
MSAIRNNSNRAEARKSRATPYARIVVRFVVGFSGFNHAEDENQVNKVFRFLGFVPADEAQELREQHLNGTSETGTDSSKELQNCTSENRLQNINDSGQSVKPPHANGSRDPLTAASSFNAAPDPIPTTAPVPAHKLERSTSERYMVVDKPQPRFTFTYTAPGSSSFSSLSELARDQTPTSSAKKKLERNPNGIYRWEGGGSAKRPRNRFSSPAFGASPVKPSRSVVTDNTPLGTNPLSDTKRQKVDERPQTPPLPFPLAGSPSSSQTNGADNLPAPRPNGTIAKPRESSPVSRLRTPAKPTAPANPSPLRQAWSDPAPSPNDSKAGSSQANSSSQPKQSKTANLMAELIKETTPAKKPDLSNPYQTASPLAKIGPPRRGNKRTRVTGKPTASAKDKSGSEQKADTKKEKDLSEYSQQAIIEATLPKGSKRSRPPAHFDNAAASSSNGSQPADRRELPVTETGKQVYTVEEPEADDEESPRKKAKPTLNDNGLPSSFARQSPSAPMPDVTIEEIGDVVMDNTKEKEKEVPKVIIPTQSNESSTSAGSPTTRNPFGGFKPSSIPKEPSKLRFSFQAEGTSAPPSPAPPGSAPLPQSTPPALPKSDFKFSPPSGNFEFKFKAEEKPISPTSQPEATKTAVDGSRDAEVKAKVRALNPSMLPVFNINLNSTSKYPDTEEHVSARNRVKSLSQTSLPVFEFGLSKSVPFSFGFDPSKPTSPSPSTRQSTPPKLTKSFESNSGISLPKAPVPVFTFADFGKASTPVAESSQPSAPPVKGFDFAAAGMKVPTVGKDTWQCSLCSLSNPSTANKCETCEAPNPKATPVAPTVKGFDFAAAGMKMPSVNKDTWQCSLCSLSNPTSATKCETCETPNPKAAPAAPPAKGFDYAAAGMKAPTVSKGTWTCSLCGLSSPESASQCVTCDNPR